VLGTFETMVSTFQRTKRSTVGIATSQTSPEQDQPPQRVGSAAAPAVPVVAIAVAGAAV
jgi:hypothetical protein